MFDFFSLLLVPALAAWLLFRARSAEAASAGGRSRTLQVSYAAKQTAIGTYATVDCDLRVTSQPGRLVYEMDDDGELIGGTEEKQDQEVSVYHYELPLDQSRVKPHTLAFVAGSAMGSISSGTVAVGASQHTITPKTARDFDLFTVEEYLKSGLQKKYGDCFVDTFDLTIERRAFWQLSSSVLGSGKNTTGSASNSEVSESSLHGRFTRAWLTAGTWDNTVPDQTSGHDLTGSPDVVNTEIESLRWSYNNQTDQEFLWHLNSGYTWGRAERGDREQTLTMTLLMERTDALDRVLNQTDLAMQLKAINTGDQIASTGIYTGASIVLPKLRYTDVRPQGTAGSRMVFEIDAQVLEHATYGSARVYVWNAQSAYLA